MPPIAPFDDRERATLRSVVVFLESRLAEQETIEWALRLTSVQRIERLAVDQVLNWSRITLPEEPWGRAWRLIEKSWTEERPVDRGAGIFSVRKRLLAGERSSSLVAALVALIEPHLKVEAIDSWRWQFIKRPKRPKTIDHLLSASLTSGELIDLSALQLEKLSDIAFLTSLESALEAAVNRGIEIARDLGWDGKRAFWRLGFLNRIYYTQPNKRSADQEPDAHHRGIAPSVKLLSAVVARIADIDAAFALPVIARWRLTQSPIYTRLWAAMARRKDLVEAKTVAAFLLELEARQFWDVGAFPEVAELRAVRFRDMDAKDQSQIANRIRKGPPRDFWPKKMDASKLQDARLFWTLRELKRITIAGGVLPQKIASWLDDQISRFSELSAMTSDEGFPEGATVRTAVSNPDERFDSINGLVRLKALEAALSQSTGGWDDPADRANAWMTTAGNAVLVLDDLEKSDDRNFPRVWDRFGWAHRQEQTAPTQILPDYLQTQASRVLGLLQVLPEKVLIAAIEGISGWLDTWRKQVAASPIGHAVWLRIWPIAVDATNSQRATDDVDLSVSGQRADKREEPTDLDTLNTPAGRLVGVFLEACPALQDRANPFVSGSSLRQMRDAAIDAPGRSRLIVQHRLIESLPDFLNADQEWTHARLIAPLLQDDGGTLALWRAIARRTHFTEVLKIIGPAMAERAADMRLGRDTRRMLVFSLVVECLHAFRENRTAAVPNARIQQMLRSIDDETRASSANAVQQFVRELSQEAAGKTSDLSAAELFRTAAAPFLESVWPQERSLATPGVSKAFADLPATSREAFPEAVEAVERFLVPFDCWSMVDYGLYGDEGQDVSKKPKLELIDDKAKARGLLRLLDLTVSTVEGAVIPHDLTDALDQIRSCDRALAETSEFKRLATAARR